MIRLIGWLGIELSACPQRQPQNHAYAKLRSRLPFYGSTFLGQLPIEVKPINLEKLPTPSL
jgi:hypothetical protein